MAVPRKNVSLVLIAALIGLTFSGCGEPISEESAVVPDIRGEYRIVSGERNGSVLPANELDDATIIIGDRSITARDKSRNETFAATYTIETRQQPWRIKMTSTKAPETGVVAEGLIDVDEDRVRLVYALPKGAPPSDFKTGEQQQMFVLKKLDDQVAGMR
jgi:uncharacterized protein (TIGR03067 family)